MSKSRGGLGRGLAALIPTGPSTNTVAEVLMGGASRLVPGPAGNEAASTGDPAGPSAAPAAVPASATGSPTGAPTSGGDSTPPTTAAPDDATIGGSDQPGPRYAEVPVGQIRPNPRNPRTVFDQDALDELAHSIREFGLLQPVVVRPVDDGYELVMGERRWRAAQQAGVETVAAIVRRTEDADLLRDALLENIHRTNLNPLEEAAAYQQLLEEFDVTQEELAARLGRSRPVISNTIRLLNLPVAVQRRVAAGVLSAGHARALLSLTDPGDQEELATRIVAEGLSVRGAEEAVTLLGRRTPAVRRTQPRKMIMPGVQELATNLSDAFDTRVLVELGRRKGKIVVEFATVDDLERLVAIMAPAVARRQRGSSTGPSAEAGGPGGRPLGDDASKGASTDDPSGSRDAGRLAALYEVTAGGFTVPSALSTPSTATGPTGPTGPTGSSAPSGAPTPVDIAMGVDPPGGESGTTAESPGAAAAPDAGPSIDDTPTNGHRDESEGQELEPPSMDR